MTQFLSRLQSLCEVKVGKTRTENKIVADKVQDVISKLQDMRSPFLFLVNSNLTSTSTDVTEEERKEGQQKYQNFRTDKDTATSLKSCVNLTNNDGIHSWICPANVRADLESRALFFGVVYASSDLASDFLSRQNPFEAIRIKLEGADKTSKIKMDLKNAWKPIASLTVKPEEKEEKKKEEPKKEEPDTAIEPDVVPDDEELEFEDVEMQEDGNNEKDDELETKLKEVGDIPKINIGRLRSLRDPHLFMLDPRERYADYRNFLGPDEPNTPERASKVLPKAIKFLVSKRIKSPEGAPAIFYFLGDKETNLLKQELKRESRPHYKLAAFDKTLFDQDEPFVDFKFGDTPLDANVIDELNNVWVNAATAFSGNPVPAVQAMTNVPLNFFRFLRRKQQPIQFYIGGQPEGAGSEGIMYVLASETEAESYVSLTRRFKLPSLFYERMSANSDIDAEFKTIDPEEMMPANVMILTADSSFDPKAVVPINEDNLDLLPKEVKTLYITVSKLTEDVEAYKKDHNIKKGAELPSEIMSKVKQIDSGKKRLEEFASDVTQLNLLHSFARVKLGSKIKTAGTFIRSGSPMIGTHIANFNANMTLCFLWGSLTQHVTINPKEVKKQLPFIKEVITRYL